MIASETLTPERSLTRVVGVTAPVVYRDPVRTAAKLLDFSATEAGSSLDMLKAAELCDDPELKRLFLRHALDEARHADLFDREARRLLDGMPEASGSRPGSAGQSAYRHIHAVRQDLYERLGLVRFVVFVHEAERKGHAHFAALADHFFDDARLGALFAGIARDEKFHVAYTARILARWENGPEARELRRARWRVRWDGARALWRRLGRQMGDRVARGILAAVYVLAVPMFALVARTLDPDRPGWKPGTSSDLWRQS